MPIVRRIARSRWVGLSIALICAGSITGQEDQVVKSVQLDEVVISAQAKGFSVEDFVRQVMSDTTFYQSFLNTKYYPHTVDSDLRVRNKKEKETASLSRAARLDRVADMAELVITSNTESGKLRDRKGEMRYLTAEMYDDVFFPKGPFIANNTIRSREQEIDRSSRFDKYKSELKKFMFNPGQEIGSVPFIGDKMALFDPSMAPYYDYRIWADTRDGHACWVFSADTKEGEEKETVIQEMSTWFDQATGMVMAREYRLLHNSLFLDFDIAIKVQNKVVDGVLVPVRVDYAGDWDIPFKSRELVRFFLEFADWSTTPE